MANWLDNITPNVSSTWAPSWTGPANMAPATGKSAVVPKQNNTVLDAAYKKSQQDLASLGGAKTLQKLIGTELAKQSAAQETPVPSFQDFLAMLGGTGGGGGVNLSGYDTMLSDVAAREAALGRRKKEQEGYIKGIIEAARTRDTANKEGVSARYQTLLDEAANRRAQEITAINTGEAGRINTRNAAREALGVAGGADLTSAAAESAGAGVTAAGDIANRDALIQQSIEQQQYGSQLAGLDPMRIQAFMGLRNNYEDRLAALASERAQVQAQRAQAAASARSGGPSFSNMLSAFGAYQDLVSPGAGPDLGGTSLGIMNTYAQANPANAGLYSQVVNDLPALMQNYGMSTTGKLMDPIEVANLIVGSNPQYGPAYSFIVDLVKSQQG